jgi:hypothetical protein
MVNFPGLILPGEKVTSGEPISAPRTFAPLIFPAASTAFKCWGCSPGFFRPALMLIIRNGSLKTTDKVNELRNI